MVDVQQMKMVQQNGELVMKKLGIMIAPDGGGQKEMTMYGVM
jgi:hypothetical protein